MLLVSTEDYAKKQHVSAERREAVQAMCGA